MFKKLVAIEPVNLVSQAEEELRGYAGEITLYEDVPSGDEEIIRRIGDADAVLVSYTSRISRYVIESCPSIRYIGNVLQPLFGGKRQCGHCLRQGTGHYSAWNQGLRRQGSGGIRALRAGAFPSRL